MLSVDTSPRAATAAARSNSAGSSPSAERNFEDWLNGAVSPPEGSTPSHSSSGSSNGADADRPERKARRSSDDAGPPVVPTAGAVAPGSTQPTPAGAHLAGNNLHDEQAATSDDGVDAIRQPTVALGVGTEPVVGQDLAVDPSAPGSLAPRSAPTAPTPLGSAAVSALATLASTVDAPATAMTAPDGAVAPQASAPGGTDAPDEQAPSPTPIADAAVDPVSISRVPVAQVPVAPAADDQARRDRALADASKATGDGAAVSGPDLAVAAPAQLRHLATAAAGSGSTAQGNESATLLGSTGVAVSTSDVVSGGAGGPKRAATQSPSPNDVVPLAGAAAGDTQHGNSRPTASRAMSSEPVATPSAGGQPSSASVAGKVPSGRLPGPMRLDVDLGDEGLGPLRFRATSVAGELHVSLTAADAHVRAALTNHSSELRRDMESAGLDLASLDVGGSLAGQHGSGAEARDPFGSGSDPAQGDGSRPERFLAGDIESQMQPLRARPSAGRLDLLL